MFTGIVEEAGQVECVAPGADAIQLTVQVRKCAQGLRVGGSLAVNGCCLTVVELKRSRGRALARFDLLEETWRRTNLQFARPGTLVNLERPLRAGGEFGGHFVTGHIDGLGKITRWERVGRDYLLEITAPPELMRYIVFKGSVAVDGISLTVAGVTKRAFQIWIIPHTYQVTNLRQRQVGDAVNIETDLIGKYIEKFVGPYRSRK
ncbi:MAG: riboflavin synthase [Verrucomicrobiae bacterium]|nr:riboflavin synthase [Verrucomicrobiae bacterium]MCX7721442.1 riboflavin synthase [Verrucomicrobiae bacterium]MDW7980471.1 riboflavin synthase [Verrucomicrobiales bacterium]